MDARRTEHREDLRLGPDDIAWDDSSSTPSSTTTTTTTPTPASPPPATTPTTSGRGTPTRATSPRVDQAPVAAAASPSSARGAASASAAGGGAGEGMLHTGPPEVQPHEIKCFEKVGGGCFGEVFRYVSLPRTCPTHTTAVKPSHNRRARAAGKRRWRKGSLLTRARGVCGGCCALD
jgi:hypothetical protein